MRWPGLCSRKPGSSAGRTHHSLSCSSVGTFNYSSYMEPGPGVLQKNDDSLRIFPQYMVTQSSKSRYSIKQCRDCLASPDLASRDSVASENFFCHEPARFKGKGHRHCLSMSKSHGKTMKIHRKSSQKIRSKLLITVSCKEHSEIIVVGDG